MRKGATVIADRGYNANHPRDRLGKAEARPYRARYNSNTTPNLYKTGNIVERMFNRIEDRRRLSLRTVRRPKTFPPAAHIAETVIRFL